MRRRKGGHTMEAGKAVLAQALELSKGMDVYLQRTEGLEHTMKRNLKTSQGFRSKR